MKSEKGSVLIISLWILAILVVFALGLGHRAMINLQLARYQRDRLRAYYLAKAGINRAIVELEKDRNVYDTLTETWSTGRDPITNEPLFENVELKEGSGETFTVRYLYDKEDDIYLCMADEERKINVNSLDKPQLKQLFIHTGFEMDAENLANVIFEWLSDTKEPEEEKKIFKNEPLKVPEEILLILEYFYQNKGEENYKNKAQELFNSIKDLIRVYGSVNTVNINTTSIDVLTVLAKFAAKDDKQRDCIPKVVDAIIKKRDEQEEKCFKNINDIKIDVTVGSDDENLFNKLKDYLVVNSNYFKVETEGYSDKITKKITVIYNRADKKIISWHES